MMDLDPDLKSKEPASGRGSDGEVDKGTVTRLGTPVTGTERIPGVRQVRVLETDLGGPEECTSTLRVVFTEFTRWRRRSVEGP